MTTGKAFFLDRDGVINLDYGYVHRREEFVFIDCVFEVSRHAQDTGYQVFVVTNQAGIARGLFAEKDFLELTTWMCEEFQRRGTKIEKVYYCPYHPEYGIGEYKRESPDRKPNPGMILAAALEFQVCLASSVLVGDKESDIEAGISAGVGCNILFQPAGSARAPTKAQYVVESLREVVGLLK